MKPWYTIENIDQVDTPALVVFPDRVQSNITQAMALVGRAERLRPHIKTHKSPDVIRMLINSGITKFKCATIAEAEILGQAKAEDVLLAYQPLGPKLGRLVSLIQTYPNTRYSCLVDDETALNEIAEAIAFAGLRLNIFLDINVGMNRTGIAPNADAERLYDLAVTYPQLYVAGLHVYDGHIRDYYLELRRSNCDLAFQPVEVLKAKLEELHDAPLILICGGSLTFPIHADRPGVECSPGTFVYWDHSFSELYHYNTFIPAAVLITRVISTPSPDRICIDLGHKSVAAENEINKRIHFLNAEGLVPVGQSEEHLVLQHGSDQEYKVGDVLYGLPYHVCPTVALYERVLTIVDHNVSGEWMNTARNRKITI